MIDTAETAELAEYADVRDILETVRQTWAPPPKLTVSEFADEHLVVTSGPLEKARWRTSFMPYQKGILDAFFQDGIEIIVLQASSQVGKTSAAVCLVAYHIVHDPCPILVVEPTVDPMAKDFSKNRLDPIIQASPVLEEAVSKKRAKDSTNTIQNKTFKGGSLSIGGANSAASLAARTIRLLILDEIDRYPPELPGEGATISIALKRTTAFGRRRRVAMLSSPTLKWAAIDSWFHMGDQRRYYVPCPDCGYRHPFRWKNVRWKNKDPKTARLVCPECNYQIGEAERIEALTKGEWRAENPDRSDKSIASFHLWEAYSPLSSLSSIVSQFLAAREAQKAGDSSLMHTFQNTVLGEAIEPDAGEGVESHVLLARREQYPAPAPAGVAFITAGIDVQDDRLEALVLGWAPGEEVYLLDRQDLPGDTSQFGPWKLLDELLAKTYRHELGPELGIVAACIDSAGHRTDQVYEYVSTRAARRIYAIIGRAGGGPVVASPSRKKRGPTKLPVALYTVGVDDAKSLWFSRFRVTTPGPGYVHIPIAPWADEELAAQLTAERLVTKFKAGFPIQVWKPIRARNEMLDCAVYGLAALKIVHPDLDGLAEQLRNPAGSTAPPAKKRETWIKPRRESWINRRR